MNILMIAYFFPPDSGSGAFRPLHFSRYLGEMGEDVWVLTAREKDFKAYQDTDYSLLQNLNEHIQVVRSRVYNLADMVVNFRDTLFGQKTQPPQAHADGSITQVTDSMSAEQQASKPSLVQEIKDMITDTLSIPDHQSGWLPPAVKLGWKIVKEQRIDVMYATGNPWTCMVIGAVLKKLTKTPLVLDFRDPWVSNYVFLEKRKFVQAVENRLERWVVRTADHLIANTEELRQDFLRRYAFLSADRVSTIPNGFEDYREARPVHNDKLTITHAGTLKDRNPRCLIEAALHLVKQQVIPKEELRLVFLGGILVKDPQLINLLKHPIVQEIADILPRLPYQDAMEFQYNSDVLLIIQPEYFALQIPRKLYEYIAFRKPILAITSRDGATATLITTYGLGIVAPDEHHEIEPALNTLYRQWKTEELDGNAVSGGQQRVDEFTNKNLTLALQSIFRQYCQTS
jgi:glycosyltransferase involved in cell wall biosynthesis